MGAGQTGHAQEPAQWEQVQEHMNEAGTSGLHLDEGDPLLLWGCSSAGQAGGNEALAV